MEELSDLEKTAISDTLLSYPNGISNFEDVYKVLSSSINQEKVSLLSEKVINDFKKYNTKQIIISIWQDYILPLINLYSSGPKSEGFNFNFENIVSSSDSQFWKQCICLLTLWKFPVYRRRIYSYEHYTIDENLETLLANFSVKKQEMKNICLEGRIWLDILAKRHNFKLPPPRFCEKSMEKKSITSVIEQSMVLFTRSHLSFDTENQKPEKFEPAIITNLINAKEELTPYWFDEYGHEGENKNNPSNLATACAVTALSHWHKKFFRHSNCYEHEILEVVEKVCTAGINWLLKNQTSSGGWPKYQDRFAYSENDVITTSQIHYACNKFSEYYKIFIPDSVFKKSERWLTEAVKAIYLRRDKGNCSEMEKIADIEAVSRAIPILGRNTLNNSTLWLRAAMKYLLEDKPGEEFTHTDVYRLNAVIEIIRRNSCASSLNKYL